MTVAGPSPHRRPRLADRVAARAVVLAFDEQATTRQLARAVAELAGGDRQVLEHAARRVRLDVLDEPRSTVAGRALAALETALTWCTEGGRAPSSVRPSS